MLRNWNIRITSVYGRFALQGEHHLRNPFDV